MWKWMVSTYCGDDEVVKEVSGSGQLKLIESWEGYKILVKEEILRKKNMVPEY